MFKQILMGSVALVAMIGQADAQDAGFNWSGFYVGAQGGYVHSSTDFSGSVAVPGGDHSEDGFLAGVHVGHDWQEGNYVFGVLADLNYVDVDGIGLEGSFDGKDESYTYDVDWLASARARAGFLPTDRLLVYGTAGGAFAHVKTRSSVELPGFPGDIDFPPDLEIPDNLPPSIGFANFSDRNLEFGGVFGVGAEFAVSQNWSVKAEYLHYAFGSVPATSDGGAGFDPSFDTVSVGLSFRFGP